MKEIQNAADIESLVDLFYANVRKDELLGPVFDAKIGDQWPRHLEKMYRFWRTILLGEHSYQGSPFAPHAQLPLEKEHFERWIALFVSALENNFSGEKAEEAKWRAQKMAEIFYHKHQYYRDHPGTTAL